MKITKFQVVGLLTILGCAAAWNGLARLRLGDASTKASRSNNQIDESFVQQASAWMPTDDGIQLLPSDSSELARPTSVQSFDAPMASQKTEAKVSTTATPRNNSAIDSSVRDLSAPRTESSPVQRQVLRSEQSSRLVNSDPLSPNGSSSNDSLTNPSLPNNSTPNQTLDSSESLRSNTPSPKRQVVDLRGRIASKANEIRGTAVSSATQSGASPRAGQQPSPEWVDSAIPTEVFNKANIKPRCSAEASNTSPTIQEKSTTPIDKPREVQPTVPSTGDASSNIAPSNPTGPNQGRNQGSPNNITTGDQAPYSNEGKDTPKRNSSAQTNSSSASGPEIVDADGKPIQSNLNSGDPSKPSSRFTPDQAIPQWILQQGEQQKSTTNTSKPNLDSTGPKPATAGDEAPKSESKLPSSVRDLAPPPKLEATESDSRTDQPAAPAREIPTRRPMTPEQAIPNWVYDQAGMKPPQNPLPAPRNPGAVEGTDRPKSNDPRSILEQNPKEPASSSTAPSTPMVPPTILPPPQQPSSQPQSSSSQPPQWLGPNAQVPLPVIGAPDATSGKAPAADTPSTDPGSNNAKKSYDPVFCLTEHQATAMDNGLCRVGYSPNDFSCQGGPQGNTFDACAAAHVYRGKFAITTQRPLVELWRPLYTGGIYPPAKTWFGVTNPMKPHFLVYGDARTAVGFNRNAKGKSNVWGNVLNLDMDLQLTSTERVHAFVSPLNRATKASGLNFNDGVDFIDGTNFNFNTLFFEGDAGALIGGADGRFPPFDLPFTFGLIPLIYQNGIWANDAVLGAAMALPAKNSSLLKWSNFDASIFWATDKITTDAFPGKDHAADFVGTAWFIDAYEGYIEADYAFVNDNTGNNLGYHNFSLAFTRRYLSRLSNSVRFIVNAGQQDLAKANRTADGNLLLIENSFITAYPNTVVPYFNLFYGQGRPQSLARAGIAGGILNNTGINFETDGITGYPTLDPTGRNTMGFASGVNLLASQFKHQLVLEFAMLQALGSQQFRNAAGNEYGFGVRYQKPLSHNLIFRTDQMVGLRDNATNVTGSRFELRWKF